MTICNIRKRLRAKGNSRISRMLFYRYFPRCFLCFDGHKESFQYQYQLTIKIFIVMTVAITKQNESEK